MAKTTSDSQVTTLDDAPESTGTGAGAGNLSQIQASLLNALPAPSLAADGQSVAMFNITVHASGDDAGNDIVEIQPNGKLYRLPRGVPCLVPEEVLHILQNAVVTKYSVVGAEIIERNIPRFPFTAMPA